MVTQHAAERTEQRYKDNRRNHLKHDLRKAFAEKRTLVLPNPVSGRATVYFSSNEHFLWKVVMSKQDGAVITVLPVSQDDIKFAISKKLLDPEKMFKKHKYI
jgi:hypothetical protein